MSREYPPLELDSPRPWRKGGESLRDHKAWEIIDSDPDYAQWCCDQGLTLSNEAWERLQWVRRGGS